VTLHVGNKSFERAAVFIASAKLNREHVLRVVYEKVGDRKLVVTFYPARKKRYEG